MATSYDSRVLVLSEVRIIYKVLYISIRIAFKYKSLQEYELQQRNRNTNDEYVQYAMKTKNFSLFLS